MAFALRFIRAISVAAMSFAVACSEDASLGADSGVPGFDASSDAATSDTASADTSAADQSIDAPDDAAGADASIDGARSDTPADARPEQGVLDGDGGCSCSLIDSGNPPPFQYNGVMSFPCYCAMPWTGIGPAPACASYEVATRCDSANRPFSLETYTNCNLVTVLYGGGFTIDGRVYDHTTHEFVGAFRGTDYTLACGDSQAVLITTGIIPGPECQTAKIEAPCADGGGTSADGGDAARDDVADALTDSADGGCTCDLDPGDGAGSMSLACYCAGAGCPGYDAALTRCSSDSPPEFNRVEDYEACNLVVITSGTSIPGGGTLVYDRTTHELVGAAFGADYPAFKCGDASVFGYRAGTFPPTGCVKSRSAPRCPRDGG